MGKKFRLEYLFPNRQKEELEMLKRKGFIYDISKNAEGVEKIYVEAIQMHIGEEFENLAIAKRNGK